jgi:hypothetical protein
VIPKLSVKTLDVSEHTFPVGVLHAHHVFHVEKWSNIGTVPGNKQKYLTIIYHVDLDPGMPTPLLQTM